MKYMNVTLLCLIIVLTFSVFGMAEEDNVLDKKGILINLIVSPYYKVDIEPKKIVITEEDFILAKETENDKVVIEKIDQYTIKSCSNIPYRLWISTESSIFTGSLGSIPVEALQWRIGRNGTWNSLSKDSYFFLESPDIGIQYTDIDFRFVVNPYLIPPGCYQGDILFTFDSLE